MCITAAVSLYFMFPTQTSLQKKNSTENGHIQQSNEQTHTCFLETSQSHVGKVSGCLSAQGFGRAIQILKMSTGKLCLTGFLQGGNHCDQ